MCDLDFKPFYVNEAGRRLVGLGSLEEACTANVQEFFFPEDQRFITEEFFPKVLQEGAGEVEVRFRHFKTGAAVWMIYNVFQLRDAGGHASGYATVSRDITERKRAEEQLHEREEQFRSLAESIPNLAWWARGDGYITWYNRRWYEYTGTTPQEMEGWGWQSVHDKKMLPQVLERWKGSIATGHPFEMEFPLRGADGVFRTFLTRVQPVKDAHGRAVRWFGTNTDIDNLKRAEEAVRSVALFPEQNPFPVLRVDREGKLLFANRASAELLKEWQWAVGESVQDQMRERVRSVLAAEKAAEWEAGVGRHRVSFVLMPIKEMGYVNMYGRDVTDQKRAENALREERDFSAAVLDTAGALVVVLDTAGRVQRFNRACAALTGYAEQEVLGQPVWSLIPPEDLAGVREEWSRLNSGTPKSRHENHWLARDGTRRLITWSNTSLLGTDGEVLSIIGTGLDITEQRRAENELRDSEEHFRSITDTTPVIMWMTDAGGVIEFVNRAYCEFFGVTLEQVARPGGWQPLVHPEDAETYVGEYMKALRNRNEFRAEARVQRADGQWRWIQSYGAPRFNEHGHFLGMAGSSPDITERKEFQAELERLVSERTSKLKELVGELEHFSYTITHDLKSPLRAMRGFAELAAAMCGEGEYVRMQDFLGRISTAAERMDHLIADALSYSRSVRQELPLDDVDSGALLRGMLDTYPELQSERAHIVVEGRLPVVLANEAGLTQCFSNLLANAVKFVKSGQMPEVRVWAEQRDGRSRIWVEDKGIGIAKEMLPRMFEMFARGSRDYEGTGIGLALVRKVAQRMGGRVGVESEEGKGSRFWIELNCREAR